MVCAKHQSISLAISMWFDLWNIDRKSDRSTTDTNTSYTSKYDKLHVYDHGLRL